MTLCIIPARGGSKRIPRKNIKPFNGKPMIAYSIEAALESGCFTRVAVSTDDEEIAAVARQYGAETPFMRPPELADDFTGTMDVIAHAIHAVKPYVPAYVCCLYATAPFVLAEDLRNSRDKLLHSDADYCFAVTNYEFPIQRAIKIDEEGRVSMFDEQYMNMRSQDLIPAWHDAGQFYWGKTQAWLNKKVVYSSAGLAYPLPRHRVQDIDNEDDWIRAEWMYKAMLLERVG